MTIDLEAVHNLVNNHSNMILKNRELIQVEGDIDPNADIPIGGKILVISRDQSYLTHGIHKFPAKFFPELPRYLIKKYSKADQTIVDPMCGSGTAILEAMLQNRRVIGIDIDPMAKLITETKTTPLNINTLIRAKKWISESIYENRVDPMYEPPIPEFPYRDKWFEKFIMKELGTIKEAIDDLPMAPSFEPNFGTDIEKYQKFFWVVFSSIIREVSNADPHCTRTVIRKKLKRRHRVGEVYERFFKNLDKQIIGMKNFSELCRNIGYRDVHIIADGDAKNTGLAHDSIDLAVTSPPYVNAVDYPRTHQLEMYWLGLVNPKQRLSKMKRKYIGTETIYRNEYKELKKSGYATLDKVLKDIYEKDPRRSFIVFKFYQDMKENLIEMERILRAGSKYCVVIGNNSIRGITVPNHRIIMEIAQDIDCKFTVENYFFSGLINHFIKIPRNERMSGDWVIILRTK